MNTNSAVQLVNRGPYDSSNDYRSLNPTSLPRVQEDSLKTVTLQIEQKTFQITLKENIKGRFLRITENGKGTRRNNIIVPGTGLDEFKNVVARMAKFGVLEHPKHQASPPASGTQ